MTAERFRQIESVFQEVLEKEGADAVAERVETYCGGDLDLCREVLALLEALRAESRQPKRRPVSLRFGAWETVGRLGSGGMGDVWKARRADGEFDQVVAVKTLRQHLWSDEFLQRFRAERQILAGLEHPNIARLLDGGVTEQGVPFLVMEYVEGTRLDEYCERKALGQAGRIALFRTICAALEYAHRNLVVHRDLKPSNILVTDDGAPKLLDFGTAKLLKQDEDGDGTRTGARPFTPDYASPEWLLGKPVAAAADVYSLGMVLYRLLTGRPPYTLTEYTVEEMIRVICEEPPAASRLDGDLDAILSKALRKEPAGRYGSVAELSDDLRRYLEHRPVLAREGRRRYRAAKFIRRHRAGVVGAAVAALLLAAGVTATAWQARIAGRRYDELKRLTASMLGELHDAVRTLPGSTEAQRVLVTRIIESIDRMAAGSGDRALQLDLAEAYLKMANLQGNPYEQNLGDTAGALESLKKASALVERLRGQAPRDPELLQTEARIRLANGDVLYGAGKTRAAVAEFKAGAEALVRLAGGSADRLAEAGSYYMTLGDATGFASTASLGDPVVARGYYRRSLELYQEALGIDRAHVRATRGVALVEMKLGDMIKEANPEAALEHYQRGETALLRLPAEAQSQFATRRTLIFIQRKKGLALRDAGRWKEAVDELARLRPAYEALAAVDPADVRGHYDLAVMWNDLAVAWSLGGDHTQAVQCFDKTREILEMILKKQPENPVWLSDWSDAAIRIGELDPSRRQALWPRAIRILAEAADREGGRRFDLLRGARAFANVTPPWRDLPRAIRYAGRCLDSSPTGDPECSLALARALRLSGQLDKARDAAARGLSWIEASGATRRSVLRSDLEAARQGR